jgi:hypothetical protein
VTQDDLEIRAVDALVVEVAASAEPVRQVAATADVDKVT